MRQIDTNIDTEKARVILSSLKMAQTKLSAVVDIDILSIEIEEKIRFDLGILEETIPEYESILAACKEAEEEERISAAYDALMKKG